jgi:hypothetical protein
MTINGFLRTFARLRKKRKQEFRLAEWGALRTATVRRGQNRNDCPLSFVAHALGKRRILALSIPYKALKMTKMDADKVFFAADFGHPALRKALLRAAGVTSAT